ncbi:DHHA1 domain-containing protein [Laribacter hongkongensis]|jgi:oligoribonuclease NrnB/cAMP/cGMP phosphodiesterase (DHH superfamily)|uniref:DHHA1 domain-containing protein n=1 Tax=Laribacter hongkongensis TaxID=168471 RepID=A0AAW5DBD4_9NEIS|nr:DHHA1 domain-containing protein [Laribacter hongkongensis]MBE5528709.1 hypothetical protein [Laribacter hongkongensis]MCG8993513.1 DHHA1 domain-containing protein [Laribacter hongkongensis]MCG8994578.1 DHHA1 domain-containing protein [Laribacter hongkongensis]MCG9002092.1 DHHA1 domain-containing protein [Laribacter hongkongensis]MCG9008092.1 DHHA1 domain-containing protein [Laribacter hongkongensis]
MASLVVYHGHCPDGFGAAYAAWLRLGESAEYVPAEYGSYPVLNVTGLDVYILDYSFPRPMLQAMKDVARSLVVLDHHKTAQADLEGFPGAFFDMEKCGARLAWEYFHPDQPAPRLIDFIEDRDIWRWRDPVSADFLAYLDTRPFEFSVWHELATLDAARLDEILQVGRHMNRKYDSLAQIMAQSAEPVRLSGVQGHKLNCASLFTSRVGELLYRQNGTFAMLWRIEGGQLYVSLRARNGTIDVAEMASLFGGGGHEAAAGFRIPLNNPACDYFIARYIKGAGEA